MTDGEEFRVGIRQGLAIGEATKFYMPLGCRVAMQLWSHAPPDEHIPVHWVQRLNLLVGRAALRFLVCQPSMDPRRLLADSSYREKPSQVT